MSNMETQVKPTPLRLNVFHPDFKNKKPGSVILQAGDEKQLCFYVRLSLLAELSSFFATLPPPSQTDMVDGTPLIPLHDTSSEGLMVCLRAIHSIHSPNPLVLSATDVAAGAIMEAVIIAKIYDLPIVHRILPECLEGYQEAPLMRYAIAAIAGAKEVVAKLGEATIGHNLPCAPPYIVNALKSHAPDDFMKLQDLHLRYAVGALQFHTLPPPHSTGLNRCRPCGKRDMWSDAGALSFKVEAHLAKAHTTEEIMAAMRGDLGITCNDCLVNVRDYYAARVIWLDRFTSNYEYSQIGPVVHVQ